MWVAFLVTWLAPPAGPYFAHLAAALALVYCGARRSWRLLSRTAPIALATSGIALMYLGLTYLWRTDVTAFALASTRFVANQTQMPVDNQIPTLLAERIRSGLPTQLLIGDWNGSDRPPLQSGWLLLNDALFSRLGLDADVLPFAAGVVAQLLWIPSLHCLLRVTGVGNRPALMAILFTAATGTLMTNTIYTWPKLLSAALVCCAMAVLIDATRRRSVPVLWSALAAALFAFAMLSHAAAAFAVPAVGILGVLTLRRQFPLRRFQNRIRKQRFLRISQKCLLHQFRIRSEVVQDERSSHLRCIAGQIIRFETFRTFGGGVKRMPIDQ